MYKLSDEEQYCLTNCASYPQYYAMRQRFESECGFCNIDTSINKTLYADDHWIVWENAFQHGKPCETMLVILTKKHLRSLSDIPKEAWTSFFDLLQWVEKNYELPGGMLFMRFGDMELNAGTVPHLHWNLWVPDKSASIRVPIFKDPAHQEGNRVRAKMFAKHYKKGLSIEDYEAINKIAEK